MMRTALLEYLMDEITGIQIDRPKLVAVDGRDCAGKTILASELSSGLRQRGYNVIEASIDGFHNPRSMRYSRGRDDPEGYYRDSFNLKALKKQLLVPLKVGCMSYSTRVFDYRIDEQVVEPKRKAEPDSILVFDGVFAHRPELRNYWNYSVYLHVTEEESLRRGIKRDPGEESEITHKYKDRYLPGQRLYQSEADPMSYASICVDNNDPLNPFILGDA